MRYEDRPDPEELLRAITQEEQKSTKGNLKIFLGMCAGVGKTYAMLEEAQNLAKNGVDIVVGVINTHGRFETAKLLEGLKVIPEKWVKYRDTVFEELDIEKIVESQPKIVIIDELAHSNVPGSRHAKRWQDVLEILDNGIDVFSTMNVQHIESLKDIVEKITGIVIRETVPDVVIQKAAAIEIIDITPSELLIRLKEGKVYLPEQSLLAAMHFFKEDKLTALREIILRYAAEKVDYDLQGMVSNQQRTSGWKPRERLLVAVSHGSHSQKLIRTTRRLAFHLDAPWFAVNVNTGAILEPYEEAMLANNLALARDLGAEIVITDDTDISQAIQRIAREKGITQIVIGRSPKKFLWGIFPRISLLDQLSVESIETDIHIIRQMESTPTIKKTRKFFNFYLDISSYFSVSLIVTVVSILNWFFLSYISYELVGFIFLLSIFSLSQFFHRGPIFFASILFALIWDYAFVPPIGEFSMEHNEDYALLVFFLIAGFFIGQISDHLRQNREMLYKREATLRTLYDIVQDMTGALSFKEALISVKKRLGSILDGKCFILLKQMNGSLIFDNEENLLVDKQEKAIANWVITNNKEAGWSTTTHSKSKYLYIPIKGYHEAIGVLIFHPNNDALPLTIEEMSFCHTIAQQLSHFITRNISQEKERKVDQMNVVESIYQSVLTLISNQLTPPLKDIQCMLKNLAQDKKIKYLPSIVESIQSIERCADGLGNMIEKISSMTQSDQKLIPIQKESQSIKALIHHSYEICSKSLEHRKCYLNIADDLPPVSFDKSLLEILLCSLILNAIETSHENSTIEIAAKQKENYVIISVSNESNKKVPPVLSSVFVGAQGKQSAINVEMGEELSLAKHIAHIHNAELKAEYLFNGGMLISLYLPTN